MSLFDVFDVTSSAISAQTVRINTVASNVANANSVSGNPDQAYKAISPVFETMLQQETNGNAVSVRVTGIQESKAPPLVRYEPNNPMADEKGYVYAPNINVVEEMANMMSASRSYQNSVEVFNTSKQLLLRTINLGR